MPTTILAPIIITFTMIGSYASRVSMGDVLVGVTFGMIGYWMIKIDFSRIPIVIALVLGPLAEQSFHTSIQISRGSYLIFVTRPFSIMLIVMILFGIAFPFIQNRRKMKRAQKAGRELTATS